MKRSDVMENVAELVAKLPPQDEFIYELLLAYGQPKASITREVLWKKEVRLKKVGPASCLSAGEQSLGHKKAQASQKENTKTYRSKSAESVGTNLLYTEIEALKTAKGTKTHNPRFRFIPSHVADVMENHSLKTMAQLYDPDKMPAGLREAHHQLDLAVDRLYRTKPFTSDEERLEHLFKLYEEMVAKE